MDYTAQIESTLSRVNRKLGREFEVHNFEYDESGGDNPYADGEWALADDSPTTVTTRLEFTDSITSSSSADGSGSDIESDAVIYLDHDVVEVRAGTEDETRATEFVDTEFDVSYSVEHIEHEEYQLAIYVEEL